MKSHCMSKTRLYKIWICMKNRCCNPNADKYRYYGGRGIKICDEWISDFMAFHNWASNNGYESTLSIERIDVNGDYEPSNCSWITMKEQHNNTTYNHYIEIEGVKRTISEWAELTSINSITLFGRIKRGDTGLKLIRPVQTEHRNRNSFER